MAKMFNSINRHIKSKNSGPILLTINQEMTFIPLNLLLHLNQPACLEIFPKPLLANPYK